MAKQYIIQFVESILVSHHKATTYKQFSKDTPDATQFPVLEVSRKRATLYVWDLECTLHKVLDVFAVKQVNKET